MKKLLLSLFIIVCLNSCSVVSFDESKKMTIVGMKKWTQTNACMFILKSDHWYTSNGVFYSDNCGTFELGDTVIITQVMKAVSDKKDLK